MAGIFTVANGQPTQLVSPSQSHHLPQSTIDHDVPADQHAEDQLPLVTVDVRYLPTVSQPHAMPASLGPARSFPGPAGDLPRTVPKENQSLEPRTSSDVQMPARSKPESAAVLHQSFTGQHPPCQSSTSVWVSTSSSPSFISALEDSNVNASSSVTIGSGQSLPAGRQLYPPAYSKPSATDRKQEESGSGHRLGHSKIDHLLIKIYLPVASHHMALLRVRLHHNKHHNALPLPPGHHTQEEHLHLPHQCKQEAVKYALHLGRTILNEPWPSMHVHQAIHQGTHPHRGKDTQQQVKATLMVQVHHQQEAEVPHHPPLKSGASLLIKEYTVGVAIRQATTFLITKDVRKSGLLIVEYAQALLRPASAPSLLKTRADHQGRTFCQQPRCGQLLRKPLLPQNPGYGLHSQFFSQPDHHGPPLHGQPQAADGVNEEYQLQTAHMHQGSEWHKFQEIQSTEKVTYYLGWKCGKQPQF